MKVFWVLATHLDGWRPGADAGEQVFDFDRLKQVAGAVDKLGFDAAVLPTANCSEESWVTASALIGTTSRVKLLVEVRPDLIAPSLAARMAATFDRLSAGRLLIHVVTGGNPAELAGDGVFLGNDARYELTDEFFHIWRRLLAGRSTVDFAGKRLSVKGARNSVAPLQRPYPALYFGGSSPAEIEVAGRHADHYLIWGEQPAAAAKKMTAARAAASRNGRRLRFGIRLHVVVRDTAAQARETAEQQRLWGQRIGRDEAALVGDADSVAERLREYVALGFETFILSGYPSLEEAYRTAELLFPRLPLEHDGVPATGGRNGDQLGPTAERLPDLVP